MNAHEIGRFAAQARRTQEKVDQYRKAAEGTADEVDRARLLAAAKAIEINGSEWADLALELSK